MSRFLSVSAIRRRFLLAAPSAAAVALSAHAAGPCSVSDGVILGPVYRLGACSMVQMAEPGAQGERLTLAGNALRPDCKTPVVGASIDFWHCGHAGAYDFRTPDEKVAPENLRYRAMATTDKDGRFVFETFVSGRNRILTDLEVQAPTVADRVKQANAKLVCASAGNVTSTQLACELLEDMTGTDLVHVQYRGSGPGVSHLLRGQVDMMFESIASARLHVPSGKQVALGVTANRRSSAIHEVPTIVETGIKGSELVPWFSVCLPAGAPEPIVAKMNQALKEAMQTTEFEARPFLLGAEPIASIPAAFAAQYAAEMAALGRLIEERNIWTD